MGMGCRTLYYGDGMGGRAGNWAPPAEFLEGVASVWSSSRQELGVRLVTNLVKVRADERLSPVIRSILVIAEHDSGTEEKLRLVIENSLMGPALEDLDPIGRAVRAGLVSTQLIGLAFIRYVWRVDPIASMADDQIIAMVAPNVQRFIDCDLPMPRRPRSRSNSKTSHLSSSHVQGRCSSRR